MTTERPCATAHLLLQADLDGELDAAGSAHLAAHLAGCPACQALGGELSALSGRLRTMTRPAVPEALRRAVAALAPRPWWRSAGRVRGAATVGGAFAAGLATAAAVVLALVPGTGPPPPVNTGLVDAHVRALQPSHLLDVPSTNQHVVKPWFAGRIGIAPIVPDLAGQGFPLLGGRLDYVDGQPAAVLVYGRDRHVIDVFVQDGTGLPDTAAMRGFNTASWTLDGLRYRAVSDLNAAELSAFARMMKGSS